MSRTVKVPDPLYEEASRIAREQDMSRGAVIKMWREDSRKLDKVLNATDGGDTDE